MRFYTTAARVFHSNATSSESRQIAILCRPTGREKPEIARRVSDVGARRTRECFLQARVVRFGVRAQLSADAEKRGAEILVAPQVLGLEARTLGGEAVGPAKDGELLAERPDGPGEPLRRVIGLGIAHKAYLQVQRGQGRREIRLPGRQAKSSANAPDHPGAERIVGDEKDLPFQLAAGNGLGHIVQQGSEAQALYAVFSHAGANPAFLQFALHAADDLEDMIQGVQVMVRTSFQFTGEGELGDDAKESDDIQRGFQCRAQIQRLASAAGLLAARIGVGTPLERSSVGLLVACGLLSRLLLFPGLSDTPVSTALHKRVDKREDKEEYDGVHEQADDLAPAVHVEAAVGESHAKEVEQAEVNRYDDRRPPGG